MARGGKRNGAGRKQGAATKKTREVADRLASEDVTPLQVMMEVMLKRRAAGDDDGAVAVAKDAAPYMHPRLSAIQHDISHSDADADAALDAELEGLLASRAGAGADQTQDPPRSNGHHAGQGNGSGPLAGGPPPLD